MHGAREPALVVDRALPEHRVELRLACPGAVGSVSDGREALALDRALRVALDHRGRLDAEQVVDRRDDVDRVDVLVADARRDASISFGQETSTCRRRHPRSRPSASSTGTGCRTPTPSRCCSGCRTRACRARRCAREVRLDRVGDAVEEPPLVERAVRAALAAGAVVGDDDDDRVVELPGLLEVVEHAARSGRRCRRRTRRTPRPCGRRGAARRRSASPRAARCRAAARAGRRDRCASGSPCGLIGDSSVSSGSSPSFFCCARIVRADRLVALVEAALVLVGPLLEHVVRRVPAARARGT